MRRIDDQPLQRLRVCAALMLFLALAATAQAQPRLAAAMDQGGGLLNLLDPATGGMVSAPFGTGFQGGVRVAIGDVNGDQRPDIIVGSGPGMVATVRVFDGVTGQLLFEARPYGPVFTGGVFVSAGDVDGDGRADIITAPDAGIVAPVQVFDLTGEPLLTIDAFPQFTGGMRVAAGDFDADGEHDIAVAPASADGGTSVRVFDGQTGVELGSVQPFSVAFQRGIYIASLDFNRDGLSDLLAGSGGDSRVGHGGGPHVRVFDGATNIALIDIRPYDNTFLGGVRVAGGDVNGDGLDDVLIGPGPGRAPLLSSFFAPEGSLGEETLVFNAAFQGGIFVAASIHIPTVMRNGFE